MALSLWSLTVGASAIPLRDLITALTDPYGASRDSIVLFQVRLPRLLAALSAGSALAVAGAIMQALTGNPLADPGLLGVNAGAAFAIVTVLSLTRIPAGPELVWVGFLGAATAALAVYALGSVGRSGTTPVKLVLAGVVVGSLLISLTTTVLLHDSGTLDEVRFWTAGSLKNRRMADVLPMMSYLLVALAVAVSLASQFTSLSLGAEIARGLGQNLALWRAVSAAIVVALAGTAVVVAGPLGFVGLVVPHIARMSAGPDYRWTIPLCLLGGAMLTLLADTLPRALLDRDIPVGVTMAVIGAPFFIHLARRRTGRNNATGAAA
ncbi:iron ABC transporter permease [Pseudoruegeria sp. HB172150]|uniref:FecCD family ABC transporter permease n=1 Tax=Pseudoruegeria sp. HB172150 TaxID=2721164 RepID=UPI001C1317E9